MSFRYTTELTAVLQQRILFDQARRRLLARRFEGRCDGVRVQYTAHGQVKALELDTEARANFEDPKTGRLRDRERLAAAVKGAVLDANTQLRHAKEEAFRQSVAQIPMDTKAEYLAAVDASVLAPHPWHALRDTPAIVNEAARQGLPEAAAEFAAFTSPASTGAATAKLPASMNVANAGGAAGHARNVTGLAATHRAYTTALLFIDDGAITDDAATRKARGIVPFADAEAAFARSSEERYFWRRTDLIRRAQINVIGSTVKRGYTANTQTPTEKMAELRESAPAFTEKVAVKFVD